MAPLRKELIAAVAAGLFLVLQLRSVQNSVHQLSEQVEALTAGNGGPRGKVQSLQHDHHVTVTDVYGDGAKMQDPRATVAATWVETAPSKNSQNKAVKGGSQLQQNSNQNQQQPVKNPQNPPPPSKTQPPLPPTPLSSPPSPPPSPPPSQSPSAAKQIVPVVDAKEDMSTHEKVVAGEYEWPQVLPEWALVAENEADVTPLAGEGILSAEHMVMERVGRGILYNAIHRDTDAPRPSKPLVGAIKGAQRMRAAMAERRVQDPGLALEDVGLVLFTERQPHLFMLNKVLCRSNLWPECGTYAEDIKVFDHIKFYDDLHMPPIVERRERFQTWPQLWLKRIFASLNSPYAETMVVDSDVYGCTDFENMFPTYLNAEADVAITLAPAPFGASRNYKGAFRPGFPKSYEEYTERNLGLHMLSTGKPQVLKLLALFRDVYIRQANDTEHVSIGNDQCAFREALFTLKATLGVTESTIPADIGCRHETGCADGCLVVHRHTNPHMSKAELKAVAKEKNAEKKRLKAEAAAAG
jgi:hypothetical protein